MENSDLFIGGDEDGVTLFMVERSAPGISIKLVDSIAPDKQYQVDFADVKVGPEDVLGELNKGFHIVKNRFGNAKFPKPL